MNATDVQTIRRANWRHVERIERARRSGLFVTVLFNPDGLVTAIRYNRLPDRFSGPGCAVHPPYPAARTLADVIDECQAKNGGAQWTV